MDCSYTGLTYIPIRDIPRDTQVLDLSHNEIQAVQTDSFLQFPELRIIRLDHNRISDVEENAFRYVKLMQLNLRNCSQVPKH